MKLKTLRTFLLPCLMAAGASQIANGAHIWINEFHYDDLDGDEGEFVEIAISNPNGSGFTASDYAIELYNGSNGTRYGSVSNLSTFSTTGPFPIAGSTNMITLYTLLLPANGLQNGPPDGIALVNVTNSTVESFLSYEGSFTATGTSGIAAGLSSTSTDVGVAETGADEGTSLAASGIGIDADDFGAGSYILATTATPGAINEGQTFAVPEPSSAVLGALGALALLRRRR